MDVFANLVDRYLDDLRQREPMKATGVGIHQYDAQLPCFVPEAIESGYQRQLAFRAEFAAFGAGDLDEDSYLDQRVALANLDRALAEHELLRPWQRDPGRYVGAVIQGVYLLLERPHAPLEERLSNVVARLRAAPDLLAQGKTNLTEETSLVAAETALQEIDGGVQFLETALPAIAEDCPALKDDLLAANARALAALADFRVFVGDLSARCSEGAGVGKDFYERLMRDYHLLDIDSQELLALGRESIPAITAELEAVARQIDPQRSWSEITAELKRDHPPNDGLLAMYQEEVDLAKAFVLEEDLVTVPADEGFWATWTPPFMWATLPFGSTEAPRPFEESNRGLWLITPVDPATPPQVQEQKLQGHNRWNARAISLHEGYPGHHMNFCIIKALPSKIRRQFYDTVFIEGWGLYTEELMWEAGYFADPRVRLIQLVNALWRAVRIVVDVSLHTRGMAVQEAIDMLVDVSRLERVNALAETTRYLATPMQASSYLLGKTLILDLRDAYRTRMGHSFNLKTFHDRLLSYGGIPPSLVRKRLLA